ncbi:MAG: ABC transporter substrate-binding protein [Methanocalculaceae archaeon]|nr:ABC transporter substrate-binding protein [Methanocalculaceae archaeon]
MTTLSKTIDRSNITSAALRNDTPVSYVLHNSCKAKGFAAACLLQVRFRCFAGSFQVPNSDIHGIIPSPSTCDEFNTIVSQQGCMYKKHLSAAVGLLVVCTAMVFAAGCVSGPADTNKTPTVEILYSGAGFMPGLLANGEIDGYIIWQPYIAVGVEGDMGKIVSYSRDLPPEGMWKQHTCCVIGANSKALKNNELTTSIVALTILGNKYINDYPGKTAELTADWLFAKQNVISGNTTINSVDILKASIPTIMFSSEVTERWIASNEMFIQSQRELGLLTGNLASSTAEESRVLLYDFAQYEAAIAQIAAGSLTSLVPAANPVTVSIGYLPSDHDAPLFVLLKDWQYFRDTYNSYLKPKTDGPGKVSVAELYINDQKIADVTFFEGSGGPQLMTLLSQNVIQYAVAGSPPYISAIDKSTGDVAVKILAPIQLEGSGLVASINSPANDWASFVQWVTDRSAAGNNVVIADPQLGSIQDAQLKTALNYANITAILRK